MDLTFLFPWVLLLHIFGAILAFGPTYAYAIIGAMGGKEPQHGNFASRVTAQIGTRLVTPLALLQGITGLALVWIGQIPLMSTPWLLIAIALYVFAITYALTVQKQALHRVIDLTSGPPPTGAPAGPPPGLPETVAKIQRGGMMLGLIIFVIVLLMVLKPSF